MTTQCAFISLLSLLLLLTIPPSDASPTPAADEAKAPVSVQSVVGTCEVRAAADQAWINIRPNQGAESRL